MQNSPLPSVTVISIRASYPRWGRSSLDAVAVV